MSGLLAGLPQAYARAWHAANPLQHGGTGLCSKRLHDDAVRTIAMTLQLSNFPHDYVWPDDDLSVIPDWVYTDQAIYEREVERIFHGPTWKYVALEAEIANVGDFIRSNVGPTPIVVTRAADGAVHVVQKRAAHR